MSFTDQKPFTATNEDIIRHRRVPMAWNCSLCGRDVKPGDTVRWVYAKGKGQCTGNFFVCETCDGDDVLMRANESFALAVKLAKQWGIYGPDWQ